MTLDKQYVRRILMFSVSAIALAAVASVIIVSEEADAYNSADYYFSGDIMESLSDSEGINEKDYSVQWKTEKNVAGYAVVNDYVYVVFRDGDFSKVSIRDGSIVNTVATGVLSVSDFPAVGDRMVLDPATGTVYDLDLNQLYKIGGVSSQAYYDNGYWYVVKKDKTCECYPAKDLNPSDPDNVQTLKWSSKFIFYIDGYTLPVSLAMTEKYIIYPGIGETDSAKRILYCVSKETGQQTDMFEMTEIRGTYWNSGFIYCEGNTVAVTTHWDNMFANPRLGDYKTIFLVDVDSNGKFVTDSATYLSNGYNDSYGSCLVMVDGLGFIQSGLCFNVIDMKTKTIIAQTDRDTRLHKTYSNMSIAVNGDTVRGYVSPAGLPDRFTTAVDGLICFEYNIKTNEIRAFDLPVGTLGTNNTNSVKIGPQGEVLFAKNDVKLYCLAGPERANNGGDSTETIGVGPIIAVSMLAVLLLGAIVFRNRD